MMVPLSGNLGQCAICSAHCMVIFCDASHVCAMVILEPRVDKVLHSQIHSADLESSCHMSSALSMSKDLRAGAHAASVNLLMSRDLYCELHCSCAGIASPSLLSTAPMLQGAYPCSSSSGALSFAAWMQSFWDSGYACEIEALAVLGIGRCA